MDADWSVELGSEDSSLSLPWCAPDGSAQWLDLRAQPQAVEALPECRTHPELAPMLQRLNAPGSGLATAK